MILSDPSRTIVHTACMNDKNSYRRPAKLMYGQRESMVVSGEAQLHMEPVTGLWTGTFSFAHTSDWDAWDVIHSSNPAVPVKLQIADQATEVRVTGEPGRHAQGEIAIKLDKQPW